MSDTDLKPALTPDETWALLWETFVYDKDGTLNLEKVKLLLHDYGIMLNNNATLYPYLTDNRITDPQHDVEELIRIADECMADNIDEAIRRVLDELFDTIEQVNTESPEIQYRALLLQLNTIYERGSNGD